MVEETGHRPLSKRTVFFYGLSEMPLQVASVVITAYLLKYYTKDMALGATVVGTIWLAARLFDAVSDLLIGHLSDITHTRWGRRRVWMVASVPLMVAAIYHLFFPTPPVTPLYFLSWMLVLWFGWSMLMIPYYAWAAELSTDYHERSVLVGWRVWLGMGANVISKIIPVGALFIFAYGGTREVLTMVGIMTLVLVPLTVGLTVLNVPENTEYKPPAISFRRGLVAMWRNGPFKRLIFAFFVNSVGTAVATAMVVFYLADVIEAEDKAILFLLTFYLAGLAGIPFWVWLSKKIGKHRAWIACLMVYPSFSWLYLLLGPGDFWWMLPIAVVTGFGGGSSAVLSNSMKADVIDLDTLKTGQNRAALFFAIWATVAKLAMSFGPALALYAIVLLGYDDRPSAVHTDGSLWGVKAVFALGPPIFMLFTAWVAWRYPITEGRHRKMRDAIARRNARRTEREKVEEAARASAEWSTPSPARAPRRLDPDPARG